MLELKMNFEIDKEEDKLEGFKGIYCEDNNTSKCLDPATGAHFLYKELVHKLKKLLPRSSSTPDNMTRNKFSRNVNPGFIRLDKQPIIIKLKQNNLQDMKEEPSKNIKKLKNDKIVNINRLKSAIRNNTNYQNTSFNKHLRHVSKIDSKIDSNNISKISNFENDLNEKYIPSIVIKRPLGKRNTTSNYTNSSFLASNYSKHFRNISNSSSFQQENHKSKNSNIYTSPNQNLKIIKNIKRKSNNNNAPKNIFNRNQNISIKTSQNIKFKEAKNRAKSNLVKCNLYNAPGNTKI